MTGKSGKTHIRSTVRKGTATRRGGQDTALRLVRAAHDLLEQDHLQRFTMRNVAERAGVSLANLQYYFPRREDLVTALFHDIGNRYRQSYTECLEKAPEDPRGRMEALLRFCMSDVTQRPTRQFFLQFWALLGSLDDFSGRYLQQAYEFDLELLSEHIAPLQPDAGKAEIRHSATLIAAMIEGLMVLAGESESKPRETKKLMDSALELTMAIAEGRQ